MCPLYLVSGIRGCLAEIAVLPPDTQRYCKTDLYVECPIFMLLRNMASACENIRQCHIFKLFQATDIDQLARIAKEYCLTKNRVHCKRYLLKKSGAEVPKNLLPDGTFL